MTQTDEDVPQIHQQQRHEKHSQHTAHQLQAKNDTYIVKSFEDDTNNIDLCTPSGLLLCKYEELICYFISDICIFRLDSDGYLSPCRTGGHIENCIKFQCNMMYKCPGSYCVPWGYMCDNKWDCPSGLDENKEKCGQNLSCESFFKCRNINRCVHFGDVCNGQNDCPLSDDEHYC